MPIGVTLRNDSDDHVGRLLAQERLMRAEAEHRLANLLQFASSNLARAARLASEPQAQAAIERAAEQVASIGRLHRSLEHAPPTPTEGVAVRLQRLCISLEALLLRPSGHILRVDIDASAQGLHLRAELARSLALIVTELVINAAKHAFPGGAAGQVGIELVRTEANIVCTVRDNGVGALPDAMGASSQGMRLADRVATQAGGSCRWLFSRAGTTIDVILPLNELPSDPAQIVRPAVRGAVWRLFSGSARLDL